MKVKSMFQKTGAGNPFSVALSAFSHPQLRISLCLVPNSAALSLWPMRVDFESKKVNLENKKIAEKIHFFTKTWMWVVWSSIITNILYNICVMMMMMKIITIATLMPLTHSPWASLASRLLIQYSSSSTRRHRWQPAICENQPVINEIHHRYQNPVSHLYTQTNCCQPFLTG